MRDKVLAYALVISVCLHLVILGIVGKTSASRSVGPETENLVHVDLIKLPDEPKPVNTTTVEPDKPITAKPAPTNIKKIPVQPEKPRPTHDTQPPKPVHIRPRVKSPVYATKPTHVSSNKLPGNPGGPLNLGSTSRNGTDFGPSGKTPTGWVPGTDDGKGSGSGRGEGVGRPEPVPNAVEGPGREPAPPPPPPDVDVKVCAESKMLPGEHCDSVITRSYRPGSQPDTRCNICKPKHVSTLADRSVPEMISGRRSPKYPQSARNLGVEGSVTVEYTIDINGNVARAKVVSSSGSSDLDNAAVQTVESRKYKPAVQAGIPRNYRKRETFHFSLD